MIPKDGSLARSTVFQWFQAKWQPDGLFFRQLSTPSDATNFIFAGRLTSALNHRHSIVESIPAAEVTYNRRHALGDATARLTTWDDTDISTQGKNVSIFFASQFFLEPLRNILNLGIMHVDIAAIHWEGNRFRVDSDVDNDHFLITGVVAATGNGPPNHLTARYIFKNRTNDYVVRYGYRSSDGPSFLPTTITNFWLSGGEEIEFDEWKILNLEMADAPLASASFDLAPFVKQNQWQDHLYTNGTFYERTDAGLRYLEPLTVSRSASFSARQLHFWLLTFYGSWGGMNLAIFALMVGAKEQNQNLRKERKEMS